LISLLAFLAGSALAGAFAFFPVLSITGGVAASAVMARRGRLIPVIFLVVGFAFAFLRAASETPRFESGPAGLTGVFVSPPVLRPDGFSQRFRAEDGTLMVYGPLEFEPGREYSLRLRVVRPRQRLNPGARAPRPYGVLAEVLAEGPRLSGPRAWFARQRGRLNSLYRERFDAGTASFLMAVTTGQRGEMPRPVRDAFGRAGLAHLLSISGTHFGLFSLLLFGLFRLTIKRLPLRALEWLTLHLTPSQAAAILTLPFMLWYLGVSGASIPSIRSFVMIGLFLVGILIARRGAWLNFLLLAAVGLVLWDPAMLGSLSFQLSFLAVLFIGRGLECLRHREPDETDDGIAELLPPRPERFRYIKRAVLISIAASLGVAPLVAYFFHYVSLIGPLANLVATPLVCFAVVPLALASALLYLLAGLYPAAPLLGWLVDLVLRVVDMLASVPWSSVAVGPFPPVLLPVYYAGFLSYWLFRRRAFLALALAPLLYAAAVLALPNPLAVTFLDAGRGDAALVELPSGRALAVDAGWSGRELLAHVRHRGITRLDALVLSHAHPDHAGGAERVLEEFPVREVWDNGLLRYPDGFLGGASHRPLTRGDTIEGEGFRVMVLHPASGFYTERDDMHQEENNDSLVLLLESEHGRLLFPGDIETEAMAEVARLGPDVLGADVLKLPHHGLDSSSHAGFLDAVSPGVAVATGWSASRKVREALPDARILLTGEDGAVRVEAREGGLRVRTHREEAIRPTRELREELRNIRRLFRAW
jgi:competence protein ComEC